MEMDDRQRYKARPLVFRALDGDGQRRWVAVEQVMKGQDEARLEIAMITSEGAPVFIEKVTTEGEGFFIDKFTTAA